MFYLAVEVTDEHLEPGQFRYIATHAWWMANLGTATRHYSYLAESLSQMWVPADHARDWLLDRQLTGRRTWLQGSHEQAEADGFDVRDRWPTGRWEAPHGDFYSDAERQPGAHQGTWQTPTPGFLAELPRDPQQLHERLKSSSPSDRPGYTGVLVYALDALRTGLVPADLRVALYQALLLLPDMAISENAANLDGTAGVVLSLDDGTRRTDIYLDPKTGQFIGERNTLTSDSAHGLKAGTVTKSTAVSVGTADAMGDPLLLPDRSGPYEGHRTHRTPGVARETHGSS